MFNCRICGKEYQTLEEAMACEQKCYTKQKIEEQERKEEVKETERKRLTAEAAEDVQLIKNRYNDLLLSMKNHKAKYHETVYIDENNIKVHSDNYCNEMQYFPNIFLDELSKAFKKEFGSYI